MKTKTVIMLRDCVPQCPYGHSMLCLRSQHGPATAKIWSCTAPTCPNFAKAIVVPMEEFECEVLGDCRVEEKDGYSHVTF